MENQVANTQYIGHPLGLYSYPPIYADKMYNSMYNKSYYYDYQNTNTTHNNDINANSFNNNNKKNNQQQLDMELELDPHRLQQRQKQVEFGKNTQGYKLYVETIPKSKRQDNNFEHPQTPNIYDKCSKRAFDGRVRQWRRLLHSWDQDGQELTDEDQKDTTGEIKSLQKKGDMDKDRTTQKTLLSKDDEQILSDQGANTTCKDGDQKYLQLDLDNSKNSDALKVSLTLFQNDTAHNVDMDQNADMDLDQDIKGLEILSQQTDDLSSKRTKRLSPVSSRKQLNQPTSSLASKGIKKIKLNPYCKVFEPKTIFKMQSMDLQNLLSSENTSSKGQETKQENKLQTQVQQQAQIADKDEQGSSNMEIDGEKDQEKATKVNAKEKSGVQRSQSEIRSWNKQRSDIMKESLDALRAIDTKQNKVHQSKSIQPKSTQQPNASVQQNSNINVNQLDSVQKSDKGNAWFSRPAMSLYRDKSRQQFYGNGRGYGDQSRVQKHKRQSNSNISRAKSVSLLKVNSVGDQVAKTESSDMQDRNSQAEKNINQSQQAQDMDGTQRSGRKGSEAQSRAQPFKNALMKKNKLKQGNKEQYNQRSAPKVDQVQGQKNNQQSDHLQITQQLKDLDPSSKVELTANVAVDLEDFQTLKPSGTEIDIGQEQTQTQKSNGVTQIDELEYSTPLSPPPGYEQTSDLFLESEQTIKNNTEGNSFVTKLGKQSQGILNSNTTDVKMNTFSQEAGPQNEQAAEEDMDTPPGFEEKSMRLQD